MRKSFVSNIGYSFIAQFVQLLLSVTVSFLLPKLLGVEQFGYWQLFIFYTQYSGFFHFGLVDGIYLREGGKQFSSLDFKCLGFQLRCLIAVDLILVVLGVALSFGFESGDRRFVLIASCIYMLLSNIVSFFALTLQSVNEIKSSSIGRLFYSVPFLVFILLEFFIIKTHSFHLFIVVYFVANLLSLSFLLYQSKEIPFQIFSPYKHEYQAILWDNIKNGLVLTLANVTGLLILGLGRFLIDRHWGIEVFSVISFALALVNFVLMFINQIGLVLYPELRSLGKDESERLYSRLSSTLSTITPFFLLVFYPLVFIIKFWLPAYVPSIEYTVVLLPIVIFEAKNQLQINTYFKVYNKPKSLLISNILAVAISGIVILFSIYVFDSVKLAVVAMLVAVVCKFIISLYILHPHSFINEMKSILPELLLTSLFVILNLYLDFWIALSSVIFVFIVFVYYRRNEIKKIIYSIDNLIRKK